MKQKFKKISLFIGDIIVLHLALALTLGFRYGFENLYLNWQIHYHYFIIVFFIWLLVFYIYNLYNLLTATDKLKFNNLTINAVVLSTLLSVAFFYLNVESSISPKTNLFIFALLATLLFILWRKLFNFTLKSYLPRNNLLIIADKDKICDLLDFLQKKPHLGFNTVLVLKDLIDKGELKNLITQKRVHTVVLDSSLEKVNSWRQQLFTCLPYNLVFIDLSSFYEKITGRVSLDTITHTWFLENFNEGNKKYFNHIKRIFDLILALILFIISLPFWTFIAIAIILNSGLPIFFKQNRLGKNGKEFKMIKFRTMINGEKITKVGSFLRKSRLDELPQLLNIIKNDMSFIGPRPEQPQIANELKDKIPFYQERLLVKPGLSGWDQISDNYHSASYLDSFEKLQYDLFYIKNRSLYLDLSIALKTMATVLRRRGR
ncbi:MAG: exopolysaccharide biosynthesis polyprenyl glycosylphosphotransferase [Candidatus Pacebacteria bacterium]|nr:exopolysaccharide biosynthesis polyprenyl glycosylphosphotransferase [Candidatus Paceibacterota bacterium]